MCLALGRPGSGRSRGGLIVVLGYYPPPDGGAFWACAEQLDTLDARYAALAERHPTVLFLDPGAVIDGNDPSDFDRDLVHPSLSGARKIADLIVSRVEQHRLDVR